jgi:hypothetical protein
MTNLLLQFSPTLTTGEFSNVGRSQKKIRIDIYRVVLASLVRPAFSTHWLSEASMVVAMELM